MNDISIVRGTTNTLNVTLKDPQGGAYVLADGEVLRFGVKLSHADRAYLILKELTSPPGGHGIPPLLWLLLRRGRPERRGLLQRDRVQYADDCSQHHKQGGGLRWLNLI